MPGSPGIDYHYLTQTKRHMLRIQLLTLCVIANLSAPAQTNWAYCFVKVTPTTVNNSCDYIFVSRLIKLESLSCNWESLRDSTKVNEGINYRLLDECASRWFYNRISEQYPSQATDLEKDQIITIAHFFSNQEDMRKYLLSDDCLLSKNEARLRRDAFVSIVKGNNMSTLLVVD
jgi:hypothetical protein